MSSWLTMTEFTTLCHIRDRALFCKMHTISGLARTPLSDYSDETVEVKAENPAVL